MHPNAVTEGHSSGASKVFLYHALTVAHLLETDT